MLSDREVALFNLGPSTELGAGYSSEHRSDPPTELGTCPSTVPGACTLNAWKVNLASGCIERPTAGKDHCVSTYPTRIEDGIVSVALPIESVGRSDGPSGPSSILRSGEEAA